MAKITVNHEMVSKFPAFKGRFGETIDAAELKRVESDYAETINDVQTEDATDQPVSAPVAIPSDKAANKRSKAANKRS